MFNLIKTISNLLNINNKEKIEEESEKTNIKYIYINENMILNGVKYEIGKRYYNEIEVKNSIYDFNYDLLANMKDYKIIKIKIFDDEIFTTKNFKIIKEINYKQFLNSHQPKFKLISIVKNKEKKAIKESFKRFDLDSLILSGQIDAIINSGLHKYLDKLLYKSSITTNKDLIYAENQYNYIANKIIKTYGRNKDLNKFLSNYFCKEAVISFGRNKDLDSFGSCDNNAICSFIQNGRYKDIKHFLYNKDCYFQFLIAIAKTGIDRYMKTFLYDNILQNNDYKLLVIQEVAKHCSKKDLDYIMNTYKEDSIKMVIAERGYDDHIKTLLSETNYSDIKEIAYHLIK